MQSFRISDKLNSQFKILALIVFSSCASAKGAVKLDPVAVPVKPMPCFPYIDSDEQILFRLHGSTVCFKEGCYKVEKTK